MIRVLDWLTLGTLGTAIVALIQLGQPPTSTKQTATTRDEAAQLSAGAPEPKVQLDLSAFPLGKPVTVHLSGGQDLLSTLTLREQADQARDWLLTAVVGTAGLTADQAARVLYDLPPIRQGYLRQVTAFEYGATRSSVLPDGQVIALVPAGSDAHHRDALAYVADARRKDLGAQPQRVHAFSYELDLDAGVATVTRREPLAATDLFSASFGYVEREVTDLAGLEEFLSLTDDVTFVSTARGLSLGGRKRLAGSSLNVTPEHIAAVWQADQKLQQRWRELEGEWNELKSRWSGRTYTYDWQRDALEREQKADVAALEARQAAKIREEKLVDAVGFSLDPAYDWQRLAAALEKMRSIADTLGVSGLGSAIADARAESIEGFLAMRRQVQSGADLRSEVARVLMQQIDQSSRYQHARYDGDIGGTLVGMNLFYTDLLAKLWAINFIESAQRNDVDGFLPMTRVRVSPVFMEEARELSSTRLWFGHLDDGFQSTEHSLLFARNATRVYAASSDPLRPGEEEEPAAPSEAFLGWWNDHYEEVAEHEPEYQRLNGIMKWSLITTWLNKQGAANRLQFLASVPVQRDHWFPDWAQKQASLRFRQWQDVHFHARGRYLADAETLPILSSKPYESFGESATLSGGVSLASKKVFAARALPDPLVAKTLRRSRVDYGQSSANRVTTIAGGRYDFASRGRLATVDAIPRPNAKARGYAGELANEHIVRRYRSDGNAFSVDGTLGDTPLGTLHVTREADALRVGWQGRDADVASRLARRLSRDPDPLAALSDPMIETLMVLPGKDRYAVRLKKSDLWLELAPDEPTAKLSDEWLGRIAEPVGAQRRVRLRWVSEDKLLAGLEDPVLSFQPRKPDRPLMISVGEASEGSPVVIKLDDAPLSGTLDASGALQLRPRDLPAPAARDLSSLRHRFSDADFGALSAAAQDGAPVRLSGAGVFRESGLTKRIETGDYRAAAKEIASNPTSAREQLSGRARQDLGDIDGLIASGRTAEADQLVAALLVKRPKDPQLLMRKGLTKLSLRRAAPAAGSAVDPRTLRNRQAFFDEVNARLKTSTRAERENLRQQARLADWQDLQGRGLLPDGSVYPEFAANMPRFRQSIGEPLSGERVGLQDMAAVAEDRAPIYVEDTPGLHAVDWSASRDTALHQVASGDLGVVLKVARADTAHFRPDKLEAAVAIASAERSPTRTPVQTFVRASAGNQPEDDEEDDDSYRPFDAALAGTEDAHVYVVVARK